MKSIALTESEIAFFKAARDRELQQPPSICIPTEAIESGHKILRDRGIHGYAEKVIVTYRDGLSPLYEMLYS